MNSVHVTLDPEDVVALQAYYYRHTPAGRRRDRILKTGPLLLALAWAWTVREHPDWGVHDPARYALYIGNGIPIIVGTAWGGLWYLRPAITRWAVTRGPRSRMLEPVTISIEGDDIVLENAHGRGKVNRTQIRHAGHTDTHCFLLFAGPNGFVIPRRCFKNDQDFLAFVADAEKPASKRIPPHA